MADDYVIEIIARVRDEASAKIRALQAEVKALQAAGAGRGATGDLQRGLDDLGSSAGTAADEVARHNAETERLRRSAPQHRTVIQDTAKAHTAAAQAVGSHADAQSELVDAARDGAQVFNKNRQATDDLADSFDKLRKKGDDLVGSYERFNGSVRNGEISMKDARRTYSAFESDFGRLSRAFERGSSDALRFGRVADDVGKKLNNLDLARASGGFEQFVAKASHAFDNVGVKIVSLSAQLRGLRLVGLVGFIQQLDTAIVGLAGGLAAVAADAAQAAGALGGSLVAGIGQAIPVAGVLLAGLERIKSVFTAVQLAQTIRQQQAFDPTQAAATALQTADALAAAQNGLSNAYNNVVTAQQQVRTSQEELTQARRDALRNIQDLTLAEKTAAEQQVGAHLSLIQAQQALQQVQASGGSQLQLQQAQLAVQEARTGVQSANLAVPRARADAALARRRGVSGNLSVVAAAQAARQAPIALRNAEFGIQQAADQLRLAQMRAASPSGHETSQQSQLNYLKSQFSGAQLALFTALSHIEAQLKNPNSPVGRIGNAIVAPVAKATQEIAKLLDDPKFMAPFQRLANAISGALGKILDVKGAGRFFSIMADDATKNVPAVTSAIKSILSLFASIAKAAAPALHRLLTDASKFLDRLADTESSVGGQKRLTAEFSLWEKRLENILRLIGAFHGLLKALATDAAPAGNSLIVNFTKSIQSATEWVQNHGPEVRKFFQDAVGVLSTLGGLFFGLAKTMLAVFNPSSVKAFAQFAQQILLPVLGDVSRAVGAIVTFFLKLFDSIPGGKALLEGLVGGFVALLVINKVADGFLAGTRAVRAFWAALKVLKDTGSIVSALKTFASHMDNVRTSAKAAGDQVKTSAGETETALAEENTAIKASTAPIAAQFDGPNGITGAVKKVPVETAGAMAATEDTLVAAEPVLATEAGADGAAIGRGIMSGIARFVTGAAILYLIAQALKGPLQHLSEDIHKWTGGLLGTGYNGPKLTEAQARAEAAKEAKQAPWFGNAGYFYSLIKNSGAIISGGGGRGGSSSAPSGGPVGGYNQGQQAIANQHLNTQKGWATALLKSIGAPVNAATLSAITDWTNAEKPWGSGPDYNNPLDITKAYGQPHGAPTNNAGVFAFNSPDAGLAGTAAFLKNRTPGIIAALKTGNIDTIMAAVNATGWTGGNGPYTGWAGASPSTTPVPQPTTGAPGGSGSGGGQRQVISASGIGPPPNVTRFTTGGYQLHGAAMKGQGFQNLFHAASGVVADRVDQGVDYGNVKGPIGAVAGGTIVNMIAHSNFDGGPLILQQLGDGSYVYYALENGAAFAPGLRVGMQVQAGQQIAVGYGTGGMEFGFSQNGTVGLPITPDTPGYPGFSGTTNHNVATAGGKAFNAWLASNGIVGAGGQSPQVVALHQQAQTQAQRRASRARQVSQGVSSIAHRAASMFGGLGSVANAARLTALFPTFPDNDFTGANDPNKALTLISKFFASFRTGLAHLHSASEKMLPITTQINDFITYSSRVFDTLFPELQAIFQQRATRLTDRGELAGFNVSGSGAVTSRGVGAADATIVSGDRQIGRGDRRLYQIARARLTQIRREISAAHRIRDPAQREATLKNLRTQYNQAAATVTSTGDTFASSVGTTFGAEQTRVQDMLTGISNRFGTTDAGLQATQGQYQSLGRLDLLPGVDTQLANSSAAQVKVLESALVRAQHMGDRTAVAQITQQIYQLNAAITQYMTQAIQDGISIVQNEAQNQSAKTSMLAGLASVATTQGNFGLAGSLSAASYTNAINSDRNQIAAYSPLLAAAKALGDQGAVDSITQAIEGLTTDLATNTQALVDNTASTDDAAASYTQARGQFQTGVYGGLAGIVQTLGQITGNVDLPTLRSIYQASNSSLQGTNNSLSGTLFGDFGVDVRGQNPQQTIATLMGLNLPGMEAGMDPASAAEFENLINSLLANTSAIVDNNQQLATLNGQLTQPQSFTSTAFSMFRDAIFTGMGGLAPTYAASLGVVNPSNPGLAGTNAPGQWNGGNPVTNIYPLVNPMAHPVDEGTVGKQIAFGMKTPSR